MTAVWVVRDEDGIIENVVMEEPKASDLRYLLMLGYTVTRETIHTPKMAAVIETAKVWRKLVYEYDRAIRDSFPEERQLADAIDKLNELEVEV